MFLFFFLISPKRSLLTVHSECHNVRSFLLFFSLFYVLWKICFVCNFSFKSSCIGSFVLLMFPITRLVTLRIHTICTVGQIFSAKFFIDRLTDATRAFTPIILPAMCVWVCVYSFTDFVMDRACRLPRVCNCVYPLALVFSFC